MTSVRGLETLIFTIKPSDHQTLTPLEPQTLRTSDPRTSTPQTPRASDPQKSRISTPQTLTRTENPDSITYCTRLLTKPHTLSYLHIITDHLTQISPHPADCTRTPRPCRLHTTSDQMQTQTHTNKHLTPQTEHRLTKPHTHTSPHSADYTHLLTRNTIHILHLCRPKGTEREGKQIQAVFCLK